MALTTTPNLLTELRAQIGDDATSTTITTRLVDHLDRAHKILVGGGGEFNVDDSGNLIRRPHIFPWAISRNPIIQNTVTPISAGTVAVTQESTAITFSSAPTPDLDDYFFRVTGQDEVYRISAHTALSTSATLDAEYVTADATAAAYTVFKLDYTFGSSNILIPVSPLIMYEGRTSYGVPLTDIDELRSEFPLSLVTQGIPVLAGVLRQGDGDLTVRLSHYPENIERMELNYVPIPSTLETSGPTNPIIPTRWRTILVHAAAFYELRLRDDDRALSHLKTAQQLFTAMKADSDQVNYGGDKLFGRFSPFPGGFRALRNRNSRFIRVTND